MSIRVYLSEFEHEQSDRRRGGQTIPIHNSVLISLKSVKKKNNF